MATHEGLTVGMPLRQRSAGKSAAPNEELAPAESSAINMSPAEPSSSTGLCANLLNATCADKVVSELRWMVLALAGIAWFLQFCVLFAPWRDNGSSLVGLPRCTLAVCSSYFHFHTPRCICLGLYICFARPLSSSLQPSRCFSLSVRQSRAQWQPCPLSCCT